MKNIFLSQYTKFGKYSYQILLLAILILMILIMGISSEHFFAWKNFRNILDQSSVYIIISVGMTFVIASGGVDLSVGNLAGMTGVIMALLMKNNVPVIPAILLGLAAGVFIGIINGSIISFLKINPFITTLATMSIVRGIALALTGGVSIYGFPQSFKLWGTGSAGPVNPPIIIALLFVIAGMILISRTLWGKYSLSLGGNPEALRRTGVNVKSYRTSIYAVSGCCAAIAGLIMTARLNAAAPLAGANYELEAIAAVILGGGSFNRGSGSVLGTFIACLLLGVLRNSLTLLTVPTYYQQIITGIIILFGIITSELRTRKSEEF
jgi:ribose transport system permease protein